MFWRVLSIIACCCAVAYWLGRGHRLRARARRLVERSTSRFAAQRESVEAEFFAKAGSLGKPRGLRWIRCDFSGSPSFAIDRQSGEIYALIAVIIGFEAIEGGDMEDVAAVSNLRHGSAVLCWRDDRWTTDGRVVFNLDPNQAIAHYRDSLSPLRI